jgi:CheY-like chemotaxis protein
MMSPASAPSDHSFVARSKNFSRVASAFVMLVGALVLTGWLLNVHRLKSVYADITMKANTSLALLLAGASLWLLNSNAVERTFARRVAQVCATLVALIGALTLSEHIFGWNLDIDQMLFREMPGALATTSPGRMGPNAATCLTLSGVALLMFTARRFVSLAQLLSIVVGLLALLAIIGYAYQAEALYGIASYTGIAVHTAVTLFTLSLGLLAARAGEGIISVVSSNRAGGLMARRLLFTALAVPFLLGWLRLLGQRAGYYDLGFGTALLVLAIIIIFTTAIWRSAAKLDEDTSARADSKAQITVSDTGNGISPAFLPYVFDRFQQADGSITRRHGGLGLGLAIARHLVEMHGGDIAAESEGEGHGAAFTVRLPIQAVHAVKASSDGEGVRPSLASEESSNKPEPLTLQGLRILTVDDELDTREMLKAVLEHYGAHVLTVASAVDALDTIPGWKPHVLVCDIGMPHEDGYTLIRKVRGLEAERGGQTPAIALTGYVRVEEHVRALEAGYQIFVPKPVEAEELTAIIASLVERTVKDL